MVDFNKSYWWSMGAGGILGGSEVEGMVEVDGRSV